jgi:hypothetical protein
MSSFSIQHPSFPPRTRSDVADLAVALAKAGVIDTLPCHFTGSFPLKPLPARGPWLSFAGAFSEFATRSPVP